MKKFKMRTRKEIESFRNSLLEPYRQAVLRKDWGEGQRYWGIIQALYWVLGENPI